MKKFIIFIKNYIMKPKIKKKLAQIMVVKLKITNLFMNMMKMIII